MRIIDNRYKIEKIIEDRIYSETYKVSDLWENDKLRLMKFYNFDIQKELISYFTDDFIHLTNINHKSLLISEKFNLVKSIDTKKINISLYYSICEYVDAPKLNKVEKHLNLKEKLGIILDVMAVIDFLHFRGFTYKLLNPSEIFVLPDKSIKLMDLASIIEKKYNSQYDDLARYFMSPEALINKDENDKSVDYYSLGILIKYLLLVDFLSEDEDSFIYKDESLITDTQKDLLNHIIKQLTKRDFTTREANLIEIIEKINSVFDLNYAHDLVESRNSLFFKNRMIGRKNEINKIMEIDKNIINGVNKYKGLVIKADFGIGKSRFISDISHRLKLKGRDVYSIEIHESGNNDLLEMSNILKQSIKDTPSDLMEKYRNELSKILPELRLYVDEGIQTNLNEKSERFRLYNRIAKYFTELSKEKVIYIMIDDIQKCNSNFIMLLEYLFNNVKSNNIFFILSYEESHGEENSLVREKIDEWIRWSFITKIFLHKLDLEEIGQMVQNILGISYIPHSLSSVLFKESQGNPRYIEYIIKHLFNIGELYMNVSGRWYVKGDSYSDLYFPSNINDAFEKQLNIIKNNYFEVFKVFTVFDDALYKRTLLSMLDLEQEKVEKDLSELISLRLIDEKLGDLGYSYGTNSSELKKLIYHEISQEEKVELHKRAVEVIFKYYEENIDLVLEELLHHLIRSNQPERALDIILERVEGLENRYGTHAKFLWEKAYNIVKDRVSPIKLKILENLVEIYSLKGESEKGNEYLEEYQRDAEGLKDYRHIIKGKTTLVDIYFRKVLNDKAFKEIEEIEDISKENNLVEGFIIALSLRARIGIQNGDLKSSEEQLQEAIKLSKAHGIKDYLGTIYNRLGIIKFLSGNLEEAVENYEKSIMYHQETDSIIEATRPINNIGNIYADNYANSEKAMEYYRKGLEIASKFGIQEVEIVFQSNISEICLGNFDFDKALQYVEEAKKGAIELQDLNMIFSTHINLGNIYIANSEYNKAYECYIYLKEIFETKQISNVENKSKYNDFLGMFYGYLGQWEKGIKHTRMAGELCKEFNIKDYLKSQCRILYLRFFSERYFNKEEIEKIRQEYRGRQFLVDRRKALLYFSIISLLNGDNDYAADLLEEDSELIYLVEIEFLETIRETILCNINPTRESIEDLILLEERFLKKNIYCMKLFLNMIIGFRLFSEGLYRQSIKYLLELLDTIYKITLKIPDSELKFSYIRSRKGDLIKEKVVKAVKEVFQHDIDYIPLRDINENYLYDYFDINPLVDIIGSEEFVKITQMDNYGEALNISGVEILISRFTDDFRQNIDLILRFIGKETFAKKGLILRYDEKQDNYVVISSLDNNLNHYVNEGILNLGLRSKEGVLINSNTCQTYNYSYKDFLSNDIKGIICVPIMVSEEETSLEFDRRKHLYEEGNNQGYIYLETDKVFNRFDFERLEMVRSLVSLVFINLENDKLRSMATTDKLTGTFTRKYYETKFEQLISLMKSANGNFSILMLDIDRFKRINDTYGHRKGDEILSLIGSVLKSTVRSTDIVARYGGEEFVIILKNTVEEEAKQIGEKIRQNIRALKIQGIDYPVTVSIGISLFPYHSQFRDDLIEKADQALYYAKETGRNKVVVWNSQMDNTANRVDKLAGILTGNTEEDNRNILALMDIIELIKDKSPRYEKTAVFLDRLLDTIDAECATMIFISGEKTREYLSRSRLNESLTKTPSLNNKIISKVIERKKGEFLIDWENLDNVDSLSGLPNWQSIIVLPLIKNEEVRGVLYITTPLKNKEFDFNSFNLSKNFANIFAAII